MNHPSIPSVDRRPGLTLALVTAAIMGERIVASPALANGRLLLRGDKNLFCVGPTEVVRK